MGGTGRRARNKQGPPAPLPAVLLAAPSVKRFRGARRKSKQQSRDKQSKVKAMEVEELSASDEESKEDIADDSDREMEPESGTESMEVEELFTSDDEGDLDFGNGSDADEQVKITKVHHVLVLEINCTVLTLSYVVT
jgi:hypothetical protein